MVPKKKTESSGSLADTIAQINETFGAGSLMKMGESPRGHVEAISTGILPLDIALGVGGFPKGRVIEIFGPFASGKSTIALHAVAAAQQSGMVCAYVDLEYTLDPVYATAIGVDVDELLISQPDNGNEALEIVDRLVGKVGVIVVDSVAALVPRQVLEGDFGDSNVGLHARLMSQGLQRLTARMGRTDTVVIFINQLREKIGILFGTPEVTTGGRALPFYASVRLDVRRKETLKQGDEAVANATRITVKKNKVGIPFKECTVDLVYGRGIPRQGCVVDLGLEYDLIQKSGSWFSYNGEQIGQGRVQAIKFLVKNPNICDSLEATIRELAAAPEEVESE